MKSETLAGTRTGCVDRIFVTCHRMSQKVIATTGCGIFTSCGVEKLEITEIIYCQTGFVVSSVLD